MGALEGNESASSSRYYHLIFFTMLTLPALIEPEPDAQGEGV